MESQSDRVVRRTTSGLGTSANAGINVLYLAADIADADYLAHEIRRVDPNIRMDASQIRGLVERLRAGRYDVVLVDHRLPGDDRLRSVTEIYRQNLMVAVLLVLGATEPDPTTRTLMAGANGLIVKTRNFINELPSALQQAVSRHRAGARPSAFAPQQPEHSARDEDSSTEEVTRKPKESHDLRQTGPPGTPAASDKRRSARYEVDVPCGIEWPGNSQRACIRDLSDSGAFLEAQHAPPPGTAISIFFYVNKNLVRLSATVRHHGWFMTALRNFEGFGVEFINLSREARLLFDVLCKRSKQEAQGKIALER
jgi:DNA-binding NarL/FixJ family response regulator